MSHARKDSSPITFREVLEYENQRIAKLSEARGEPCGPESFSKVGLAFSGGGIRSATFNLGVLQGLAKLDLLRRVHYLSTVSGGGYIGAWLCAWIHRRNFQEVQNSLAASETGKANGSPRSSEPPQVRFLRQFSNYLTPRLGAFSADTWTVASIYVRNLLLNATTLIAFLVFVLLLPRVLVGAVQELSTDAAVIIGFCLVLLALIVIAVNLRDQRWENPSTKTTWLLEFIERRTGILFTVVGPLWAAAVFWSALPLKSPELWHNGTGAVEWLLGREVSTATAWACIGAVAYGLVWLPAVFKGRVLRFLFALIAGALGGILAYALAGFYPELKAQQSLWPVLFWGPTILLAIFFLVSVLHVGLMGSLYESAKREWRGRLGAWILITMGLWSVVYGIAVYSPVLVHYANLRVAEWASQGLVLGWFVTSVTTVLEGRRGESSEARGALSKLLLSVGPFVFVLGLLIILSTILHRLLALFSHSPAPPRIASLSALVRDHHEALQSSLWLLVLVLLAVSIIVMLLMSWRVDINEFSMHNFYRNRLTRAYLGASVEDREKQPFTGLADDDLPFTELDGEQYDGPYPILNTTLNLTAANNPAWQQRKAGSFVFTPKHCGYWLQGVGSGDEPHAFADTKRFGLDRRESKHGITLGTIMAISGAAATPNMGSYSSPALAFLMTVFNVRLGWWVGNPCYPKKSETRGPGFDLFYWLSELFGTTNEESDYLYVSDGGHFENLGIYELVRRRCRLIIACDAAADPNRQFSDLGNAVEKIRNDLGIDIELETGPLEAADNGFSEWHAVVGRIYYPGDAENESGTLVYIKSTLTGNEPPDVLRYAKKHASFPHQSTGDQWFSESQFESYRALGRHSVESVFKPIGDRERLKELSLEDLCNRVKERWYPSSPNVALHFSKHAARVSELFEVLRKDMNLEFLDEQVYTELTDILRPPEADAEATSGDIERKKKTQILELAPEKVRAGFYFCNELIQLMENVYVDLDLEQTFEHPDNRGWMNIFRRWSWSEMFKTTFVVSASTYGARFQTFCRERLDLELGQMTIREARLVDSSRQDVADELRLNEQIEKNRLELVLKELEGDIRAYAFDLNAGERTFHVGFAVATFDSQNSEDRGALRYFRIQNQVRKMGLGRKALAKLVDHHGIESFLAAPSIKELRPDSDRPLISEEAETRFALLFQSTLRECHQARERAQFAARARANS